MKCPHCNGNIDVRFIKAPADAQAEATPHSPSVDNSDLETLLDAADNQPLEGWSATFVADLRKRFTQYGSKTFISAKQMTKLRQIANGEGNEF